MKSKYLDNHIIYKLLLLTVFMLNTITALHTIISPFFKALLVVGVAILIFDFIRGKRILKDKSLWALLAFAAVYLVSIIINRQEGLSENLKELSYMVIFMLTLYGGDRSEADADFELEVLGRFLFMLCALLSIANLATYLFAESSTYVTGDGLTGYIGSFEGRMCGLVYMNTGGAIYALLITISFAFLWTKKLSLVEKILCYIGIALGLVCLVLANSRTSIAALILTLVAAVIWLLPTRREKLSESRKYKAFQKSLLILLAVGFIIAAEQIFTKGPILWFVNNVLSGRGMLWTGGIDLWKESPLFGTTAINFVSYLQTNFTGWEAGGIHSLYLAVPVYSGIFGCIALTAFTVINSLRARGKIASPTKGFAAVAIIIMLALFMELAEARAIFKTNIFSVIFWIALGNMRTRLDKR